MNTENEDGIEQQNSQPEDEITDNNDNEDEIDHLTRRKAVLNNVLGKMIDKINQSPKA